MTCSRLTCFGMISHPHCLCRSQTGRDTGPGSTPPPPAWRGKGFRSPSAPTQLIEVISLSSINQLQGVITADHFNQLWSRERFMESSRMRFRKQLFMLLHPKYHTQPRPHQTSLKKQAVFLFTHYLQSPFEYFVFF